jgi:hypothetical protein
MSARRIEPVDVVMYGRDEFVEEVFDYEPGDHVTIVGPTGSGKTYLAQQLIQATATPELPAVVIAMKPRDATLERWSKSVGYRRVKDWPPQFTERLRKKPAGFILKPDHAFDPDIDNPRHRMVFRRAILGSYKKGNRIIFADELYSLCAELDLDDELVTVWTKGRSMEAGVWGATQRPSHVPLWAYSQATHLFLAYDPEERSQKRFGEISGVNSEIVISALDGLQEHQWLYVNQTDRTMCVIDV